MAHNTTATTGGRRPRRTEAQLAVDPMPPHRLEIVTVSVAEAVQAIGGWLTDRALAGWEVTVFATEMVEETPLRILGARQQPWTEVVRRPEPERAQPVVSIAAKAAAAEPDLWHALRRRYAAQTSRLLLWGDLPCDIDDGDILPTDYQMSCAGNAFKAHALWSLGLAGPTSITERLYRLPTPGRAAQSA